MNEGIVRAADALQSQWMLGVLLLLLILVAWCNVQAPQKMTLYVSTSLRLRPLSQASRSELSLRDPYLRIALFVSALSIAVFVFQVAVRTGVMYPEFHGFAQVVAYTMALVLGNGFVIYALGLIFEKDDWVRSYIYQGWMLLILLGLLMLPVNLVLTYAPLDRALIVSAGLILMVGLLIFRWIWGLAYALRSRVSPLYIVLYLCAAEILPVVVVVKLLGVQPLIG